VGKGSKPFNALVSPAHAQGVFFLRQGVNANIIASKRCGDGQTHATPNHAQANHTQPHSESKNKTLKHSIKQHQ
jgi:hypothetical protein